MKLFKLFIPLLLMASACSLIADRSATDDTGPTVGIDTSPEAQAKFKAEWLEAATNQVFSGEPDLFGGGSFGKLDFAFDKEGSLHYRTTMWGGGKYTAMLRPVLFAPQARAVVQLYKNATTSELLRGEVYALEIRSNKIYRTQNVVNEATMGFTSLKNWDKKSYSTNFLQELAALDTAQPYPSLVVPDPAS